MRFEKSIAIILTFTTLGLSNSFDVLYDTDREIAGFQFSVVGVEDGTISASGADAAANGFSISAGGTTVLGFSFTGSTIPAGSGVLVTVDVGDADVSSACIDDLVLSDAIGNALDFNLDCASFVVDGIVNSDIAKKTKKNQKKTEKKKTKQKTVAEKDKKNGTYRGTINGGTTVCRVFVPEWSCKTEDPLGGIEYSSGIVSGNQLMLEAVFSLGTISGDCITFKNGLRVCK